MARPWRHWASAGVSRGEPGSQAQHSEVRQFYGAVNASKSLPERVKLPPAPKAPEAPSGMAAGAADVVSMALGIETPHQRAMKAHVAMAPLEQRTQNISGLPTTVSSTVVPQIAMRRRPR